LQAVLTAMHYAGHCEQLWITLPEVEIHVREWKEGSCCHSEKFERLYTFVDCEFLASANRATFTNTSEKPGHSQVYNYGLE